MEKSAAAPGVISLLPALKTRDRYRSAKKAQHSLNRAGTSRITLRVKNI